MHTTKTLNYKNILAEIAEERGLTELAEHIKQFNVEKTQSKVFNITKMPEATCDGCQ